MSRAVLLCCCIYFVSLAPMLTSALSDEQKAKVHEEFVKHSRECVKDNPITAEDIASFKAKAVPTGEHVPCFLSCMLKRIGVMDANGSLSKDNTLEIVKKVFTDAEEMKLITDYLHSCQQVNTEPVGDGAAGCERAMKAYQCMLENRSQFGFDI